MGIKSAHTFFLIKLNSHFGCQLGIIPQNSKHFKHSHCTTLLNQPPNPYVSKN